MSCLQKKQRDVIGGMMSTKKKENVNEYKEIYMKNNVI